MKNDDQMYQSVLSRRDAYRLQQQKRIRTVKRLAPVLACFCFTVVLGLEVWQHRANLPHVPVKTVTETTATTETTTTIAETTSTAVSEPSQIRQTRPTTSATVQTEKVTEVCTTVTNAMTTASSQQTSTAAVTATAAPQTTLQTQAAATTQPVIVTQPETHHPGTDPPLTARITPQTSTMEVVTTAATPATTVATPSTTAATMATTAETTEPIQPEPPPQEPSNNYVAPLQFREISDLTETLTTFAQSDGSSYEEPRQSTYRKMFDRFLQDGFVYELLETDSISRIRERGISLYPYARFEDIGAGYAVNYCDKFYYVTFYSADTAFLDGSGSISEYLQARMKRQTDKEITVQEQTVSVVFANGGQILANVFVDDSHYLNVRTSATEEELIAFLNEISYEQTPLQSDRG